MKKKNLLIIGCGGNGSNFIKYLLKSRFIYILLKKFRIYLIDGDKVEEKNISRQYFFKNDIYNYKVVSLLHKIETCVGKDLDIVLYPDYNPIIDIVPHVTILAVDNQMSRRYYKQEILDRYLDQIDLYIDVGNELYSGQIFCINKNINPLILNLYQSFLKQPDLLEEASCSELEQSREINNLIAYSSYLILKSFILSNRIEYNFLKIQPLNDFPAPYTYDLYEIPTIDNQTYNPDLFMITDPDDLIYFNQSHNIFRYFKYENFIFKALSTFQSKTRKIDHLEVIINEKNNMVGFKFNNNPTDLKTIPINYSKKLKYILKDYIDNKIIKTYNIGCVFSDYYYKKLKEDLFILKNSTKTNF